jgi:hypothetical protein
MFFGASRCLSGLETLRYDVLTCNRSSLPSFLEHKTNAIPATVGSERLVPGPKRRVWHSGRGQAGSEV